MKIEYDISTKDEKEVSYIDLIDTILDKLGFNKANNGTRLLRKFIIYVYLKDPLDIDIKREINAFIRDNKLNTNYNSVKQRIQYAIYNCNIDKMKKNFYAVFHNEYDYYFLSVKNMVNFILNVLEKNKF